MKGYPLAGDLLGPVLRAAIPRASRLIAPGGTVHVVARCNNRDFYLTSAAGFQMLLAHLGEMRRTYQVTLCAYRLMDTPRSEYGTCRGQRCLCRTVHPAPPPQSRFCVTATSSTWRVRGVRCLFAPSRSLGRRLPP